MTGRHLPGTVRAARWSMIAGATILLGMATLSIGSLVVQAAGGVHLVFSQDEVEAGDGLMGPAPGPGDPVATPAPLSPTEATGGYSYVDLPGLGLTIIGGGVAAAGAFLLDRRSRWTVPVGLSGMAVVAAIGSFPALLGAWAASFYGLTSFGQLVPYLAVSAILVGAALAGMAAIWRYRSLLAPG